MKNSQFRRISINETGRNSIVHGNCWERMNSLMEESLQLTDQYRAKFENSRVMYENFKPLNSTQSVQFPSRPAIPIELIGKSLKNHSNDILTNSDLNKSDDRNTLIGQYEISHTFFPRTKQISPASFESLMKFHEKLFFQSFPIYSKYLHDLFELYFSSIDLYDHLPFQTLLLSFTEQIKDVFKRLFSRYRIVIQTYLYEHFDQSILIASKCLINRNEDYLFEEHLIKRNIHLLITMFFLYQD